MYNKKKKKQWCAVHIKTRIDSTNISLILNMSIDISTNMVNEIIAFIKIKTLLT